MIPLQELELRQREVTAVEKQAAALAELAAAVDRLALATASKGDYIAQYIRGPEGS